MAFLHSQNLIRLLKNFLITKSRDNLNKSWCNLLFSEKNFSKSLIAFVVKDTFVAPSKKLDPDPFFQSLSHSFAHTQYRFFTISHVPVGVNLSFTLFNLYGRVLKRVHRE